MFYLEKDYGTECGTRGQEGIDQWLGTATSQGGDLGYMSYS